MGSHAAQTYRDRTEVQNWHTISADSVSWANVTTLIVSPKLVRLLVIRGKYLITSGLPVPRLLPPRPHRVTEESTGSRNLADPVWRKADTRKPAAVFLG